MQTLAIRCHDLVKVYPPDVRAVDGLDLEVAEGECFGLLGPNGAGKTTTIEVLEGLLEPTSGEVEVLGHSWKRADGRLRQQIGISLQETRLPEKLSVAETIRLFGSFYRSCLPVDDVVRMVGLEEKATTWVGRLSGGQRQRLEIACALVGRPALVFLDEPTTGLDPSHRRELWDIIRAIRAEGRTVLITTHYMDEAERLCDRVAIIDRGRVIALGTPSQLIATLGGEHVIEFAATGEAAAPSEPSPLDRSTLERIPGVLAARVEPHETTLTVSKPHIALPPLLEALRERRLHLTHLTTRHASLEDVFVGLTGRHLDRSDG